MRQKIMEMASALPDTHAMMEETNQPALMNQLEANLASSFADGLLGVFSTEIVKPVLQIPAAIAADKAA